MIKLPESCEVNKFIPKKTFYEKVNISSSAKQDFIDKLEKIYWKYKLSEDTINITKTDDVEEIEIFELVLKEKCDIKSLIKVITKEIPYIILFLVKFNDEFQYAIKVDDNILISNWNEEKDFKFVGFNLKEVYNDIVRKIINDETTNNIKDVLEINKQKEELEKKINTLKSKINKEIQFKKKVELNHELRSLEKELEELLNE
ncbi:MAG: DUF4391 domain-containing protein [Clostridia bacterium]|nr:DUF4391 domain-containing protein [Clostridia bacterium]